MLHKLYVAEDSDFAPLAAIGIAAGRGPLDTTFCKWALLLPHRPARPYLQELVGPSNAVERMRALAFRQAVCCARNWRHSLHARDFRPAPWHALQRWVVEQAATHEALVAVAAHLGNADAFDWLGWSAERSVTARAPTNWAGSRPRAPSPGPQQSTW